MNEAASADDPLSGTAADRLLSDLGRRIFFPKGIVFQAAEAGERASRFNCTAGIAMSGGAPLALPSILSQVPGLSARETVSYAATLGVPELREAWKRELIRKNPSLYPAGISLPAVLPGLTAGISTAADLFVNPGDDVFLPDPSWDNYQLIFQTRRGAVIHRYPLFSPPAGPRGERNLGIRGMIESIRTRAERKKAVLLLNFPNNPTGYSPTIREARELVDGLRHLAEENRDILVIVDDAYFGLTYTGDAYGQSLFAPLAGIHPRILAVKVDGATKEDYTWGFRIGFMTFAFKGILPAQAEALTEKLSGMIRCSCSSSSRIGQSLLLRAMLGPEYRAEKERFFRVLSKRFLKVSKIVSERCDPSILEPLPFNSGYFLSFLCKGFSAEELRRELLERERIGVVALGEDLIRVAYSSIETEGIEECFKAIFETAERFARRGLSPR
jgi:aspartate/methionine/tyrosine aminotransferase